MEYLTKFIRITNSGHLTDRFLTAQVKLPQFDEKIPKGSIFSVMEINIPRTSAFPIGNRIINTFIRSYYKVGNASETVNFELAIKDVNDTLGKITRNGETNWIGNLNSVMAVINQNQLYLTQSGKAEAYLFRESKVSHITENLSQNLEPHPLKTFSNIVSGELKVNDKILLASPKLFDYLSVERLKQIMGNNEIFSAAQQITTILKKEKTREINLIIIELNTKKEFSSRIIREGEDTIYLDKENFNLFLTDIKEQLNSFKPLVVKIGKGLSNTYQKTVKFSQEKIAPSAKVGWSKLKETSQKNIDKIKSNTLIKTPKELKEEKIYEIHRYNKNDIKTNTLVNKISPFFSKIKDYFKNILDWLLDKKHRSILYIIFIVILLIVLIFSIGKFSQKRKDGQEIESRRQELNQAESRFEDEAKLAILYNDNEKALDILTEIIAVCERINDINELENEANDLLNQAQEEIDKLTDTIRIKDKNEVAAFSQANQFTIVNDMIFSINSGGNYIELNLIHSDGENKKIEIPPIDGTTKLLTYLGDEKNVMVYTNEREMYKTTGDQKDLEKLYPIRGQWSETEDIVTFFGSIYALDKNQNQIIKYHKTDEGYEKGINYIKDDTQSADVVSFAIDSKVYLLKQNGEIIKLNRGKKIDFNIPEIPKPTSIISNPKKIYTDIEATCIWILDGNRIIELDKTGTFIKQYVFNDLNNIDDFIIDYEAKKFWILDSNKVYECNY